MTSPLMTVREVAFYLRFVDDDGAPKVKAAWSWIGKYIPKSKVIKRGRIVLVHREDVVAALTTRESA